jgi:V/A-type H+-transporting ATPase subunit C
MKLSESRQYGFAIGRLRSLETRLLDRAAYRRFIVCPDEGAFVLALGGTHYAALADPESGTQHVNRLLGHAHEANFEFLVQHSADNWLLQLFRIPADAHNLKVLLKSRTQSAVLHEGLLGYGRWSPDMVRQILDGTQGAGGSELRSLVATVREQPEDHEPAEIDAAVDQWMQSEQLRLAPPGGFMSGYLTLHADVENLRSLIRLKSMNELPHRLQRVLLIGGNVGPDLLRLMFAAEWETLGAMVADSDLRQMVDEGSRCVRQQQSALRLERLGRETELRFLAKASYTAFGYEPLAAFFLQNENEVRNLRQLHAACIAGLPEEERQELVAVAE